MAMSRDGRFWRNVTLITLAHVTLIAGLIRWSVEARSAPNSQSIVWLGDVGGASAATEPTTGEPPPARLSPSPQPTLPKTDEAEKEKALLAAAKSEIELPTATPTPTSRPKPPATPTPKPTQTPKPTPKKTASAKASPKPPAKTQSSPTKSAEKAKKADANAEKKKIAKTAPAKNGLSSQTGSKPSLAANNEHVRQGTDSPGRTGGGSNGSEFGWYGSMLHDRFYSAWIQPTANIATGTKISTLVKVRIEKDGRVSSFEIIKPSENVVVNESVAAIAKRVTEVDPPPNGLSNGDHYDVKINFELNADQGTAK
jgi:TonB family protein